MTNKKTKTISYIVTSLILVAALAGTWFFYTNGHAKDTASVAQDDNYKMAQDDNTQDDNNKVVQDESYKVVMLAEDLTVPWSLAFLPDAKGFLVTERGGRLLHLSPDGTKKIEIKGLPKVYAAGQSGLFSLIFSPEFKKDSMIYFAFAEGTSGQNNTALASAKLDMEKHIVSDVKVIFRALPKVKGSSHYGGHILMAPDGTLFLTLGDRFEYRDSAQVLTNHLGKIVRINPDGSIPKDNPFVNNKSAKPEIYSYGHRNIQGIALQPGTTTIWEHEHGPRGGDEVNILKPAANYGWPVVTFGREYSGREITDKTSAPGMEDPIINWVPSIAPSGMAFYDGDKFPQWRGDIFVGALAGQHLRHLKVDGRKITQQTVMLKSLGARIRDVRGGPDGYIYILTESPGGRLIRLEPK